MTILQRLACTVLLLPALASASSGASPLPAGPVAPVAQIDFLNVGTGLLLVIGAILLCGWLYARSQQLRHGANDLIRVIASQPLGAKERVVLLQVAGRQLLVGMTSANVQTLHVFDDPIDVSELPTASFTDRFRAIVKGQSK